MVVMMERPPAASSLRISTQCMAVVESRPAQSQVGPESDFSFNSGYRCRHCLELLSAIVLSEYCREDTSSMRKNASARGLCLP